MRFPRQLRNSCLIWWLHACIWKSFVRSLSRGPAGVNPQKPFGREPLPDPSTTPWHPWEQTVQLRVQLAICRDASDLLRVDFA